MPFFTVKELAARWGCRPATVRWKLLFLRQRLERPPAPDQVRRGPRGMLAYRADYVALVGEVPPR